MLCSDGFRHEITEAEMYGALKMVDGLDKNAMHGLSKRLIDLVKSRKERDNITVVLIKAE